SKVEGHSVWFPGERDLRCHKGGTPLLRRNGTRLRHGTVRQTYFPESAAAGKVPSLSRAAGR
ncbi:MAG: hypothetical protein ACLFUF_04885, partial [Opitutales bacterium]